jgi:hypothetical protein
MVFSVISPPPRGQVSTVQEYFEQMLLAFKLAFPSKSIGEESMNSNQAVPK